MLLATENVLPVMFDGNLKYLITADQAASGANLFGGIDLCPIIIRRITSGQFCAALIGDDPDTEKLSEVSALPSRLVAIISAGEDD
ncbi:hypothetical protein, partial [Microvirga sp. P5_D2]